MEYSEMVMELTAVYQQACTGYRVFFSTEAYSIYHDLAVIRWAARER